MEEQALKKVNPVRNPCTARAVFLARRRDRASERQDTENPFLHDR